MFDLLEYNHAEQRYMRMGGFTMLQPAIEAFFTLPSDCMRKVKDTLSKEIVIAANAGSTSVVRNPGYFNDASCLHS